MILGKVKPMRIAALVGSILFCSAANAEESALGVFRDGVRIGTSTFSSSDVTLEGKPAKKSVSKTTMNLALLGRDMTITLDSSTWTDVRGRPILMRFRQDSGGKWQRMEARFGVKSVDLSINEQGRISKQRLKIPAGPIVDDPISLVLNGQVKPGAKKAFYVLDSTTYAFMLNTVAVIGPAKTTSENKSVNATLVEIKDVQRGLVTRAFLSGKGDPIRLEAPLGIVMIPEKVGETRRVADGHKPVENGDTKTAPSIDLATISKIVPSSRVEDPTHLLHLKLKFSGPDLAKIPSDEHQTVTKSGSAWIVDVHPVKFGSGRSYSILQAQNGYDTWLQPSLHIPSDEKRFLKLARQIIGTRTTVKTAASQIRRYVYGLMEPNAGMGILRNANDVLDSKQGVCRDYAILTTTLLRAAGIPARLASGLVSLDGEFYYHAWAEAWDGAQWIGVDSTTDMDQISAAHIKLADGNVDSAFAFMLLDKVKLDVLESSKK